jgi:hypothetical protein
LSSYASSLAKDFPDAQVSNSESGNTLVISDDFKAVIFTKEYMDAHKNKVGAYSSEYWTPNVGQIALIESRLEQYLSENGSQFRSGRAPSHEELAKYIRQYYGVVGGETKWINVLFSCPSYNETFDWKKYLVSVKGGGECFFGVGYDVIKQEFIGLGINSPE